jgi:hypothetical protein
MPLNRKAALITSDDMADYMEDRDLRSSSVGRHHDKAMKEKYDNYRWVKPGDRNEPIRKGDSDYFNGEPEWHNPHRGTDNTHWTKRGFFEEAKRHRASRNDTCFCCSRQIGKGSGKRAAIEYASANEGKLEDVFFAERYGWHGPVDGEGDVAEEYAAWNIHDRRKTAAEDIVARAAADYEDKQWEVLRTGRTRSRGHGWERSRSTASDDFEHISRSASWK